MEQSRTVKSIRNFGIATITTIATFIFNYIGRVVFVKYMDSTYLGIHGLFTDILSILALADLGIATTLIYSLYKPLSNNDENRLSALVNFFKKVYLMIALVIFILGLLAIPLFPFIIKDSASYDYLGYYLLFLLETVSSYLFVYRTSIIFADQKSYVLTKYTLMFQTISFILKLIVVVTIKNYYIYISIGILLNIISNLCQNLVAYRMYPFLKTNKSKLDKNSKEEIFKNVKATFLYKFSGTIQNNTDSILISTFVGLTIVGYYSNYVMIVNAIITFINILFRSIKASVGNFISENNENNEEKLKLFNAIELASFWIVSFCSISFLCLFDDFIIFSFGIEYKLTLSVLIAIILNFYTSNIRQNLWLFRETTGVFVQTKYLTLITAILNIVFSIVLGQFWGIFGVLIATTLARLVYSFWREPQIIYDAVFKKSSKDYFIKYFLKFMIMLVLGASLFLLCQIINTNSHILNFFIKSFLILISVNTVYLLIYRKNKNFKYLVKRFKVLDKIFNKRKE